MKEPKQLTGLPLFLSFSLYFAGVKVADRFPFLSLFLSVFCLDLVLHFLPYPSLLLFLGSLPLSQSFSLFLSVCVYRALVCIYRSLLNSFA